MGGGEGVLGGGGGAMSEEIDAEDEIRERERDAEEDWEQGPSLS